MTAAQQIAIRHFGKRTVNALGKRGVRIIGTQVLPNMAHPMPWADADTCYVVDDNGTGRVWTAAEVRSAAA